MFSILRDTAIHWLTGTSCTASSFRVEAPCLRHTNRKLFERIRVQILRGVSLGAGRVALGAAFTTSRETRRSRAWLEFSFGPHREFVACFFTCFGLGEASAAFAGLLTHGARGDRRFSGLHGRELLRRAGFHRLRHEVPGFERRPASRVVLRPSGRLPFSPCRTFRARTFRIHNPIAFTDDIHPRRVFLLFIYGASIARPMSRKRVSSSFTQIEPYSSWSC